MPKTVSIPLTEPVRMFENEPFIEAITLREPTARDLFAIGEPRIVVGDGKGAGVYAEVGPAIEAYLDRCIDHPQGARLLVLLNLRDGRAIKEALLDFFRAAETAPAA